MYQIDENNLRKIVEDNSVTYFNEVCYTCYKSLAKFFNDRDYGDTVINDDIISKIPFDDLSQYKESDMLSYIRQDLREAHDKFSDIQPDSDLTMAMHLLKQYKDSTKEDPFVHRKWLIKKLGRLLSKSNIEHCNFKNKYNTINVDLLGELNSIINIGKINKTENLVIIENGQNTIFINKELLSNAKNIINRLNKDYIDKEMPKLDNLVSELISSDNILKKMIPTVINKYACSINFIKDDRTLRLLSELKSNLEKTIIIGEAGIKEEKNTLKRRRI